jgi:hypothetical protein
MLVAAQRHAERPVGRLALGRGGGPVHGRPQQRVTKFHAAVRDLDDAGRLGGRERLGVRAQRLRRAEHHREIAALLGRRHQQQRSRPARQALDPPQERPPHRGADRQRVGKRRQAGQLAGAERRRQLEQGERVAARRVEQVLPHLRRQRRAGPLGQQRPGRLAVQGAEPQLRHARRGERARVVVAGGEQQEDALGLQPAGGEGQRLGRGPVEPLGVVDQPDQWGFRRDGGQQAERPDPDQKAVAAAAVAIAAVATAAGGQPEGSAERGALRFGEPPDPVEHGTDDLVEGGEGKLRLRFDPEPPQDPRARDRRRVLRRIGEQRGFANTSLAAKDQRPAAQVARIGEKAVQHRALGSAAMEHLWRISRGQGREKHVRRLPGKAGRSVQARPAVGPGHSRRSVRAPPAR